MAQRLALDRALRGPYYLMVVCLTVPLAACPRGVAPIAPADMPPLTPDSAVAWVDALIPGRALRYDVRWAVETQQGQVRGRAAARVHPPDSLRFDYRAPFGRSGAAVVIGDSLRWAEPEDRNPVPPAPLFWAALGIPLHPPAGAAVVGREVPGERAWRYAIGHDTLTYVASTGSRTELKALFRRGDEVVGTVTTTLDAGTRLPIEATVLFPQSGAFFLLTVQEIDSLSAVDPEIWDRP